LNEKVLGEALATLQYRRIKPLIYMAEWSMPDVEHFLYVSTYGTPREYLQVQFGFRNKAAERFGVAFIKRYGGRLYSVFQHREEVDCAMQFSLGRLAGWGMPSSIYMPEMSQEELAAKVTFDVQAQLFPVVRHITSLDRLIKRLLDDTDPCRWTFTNGAIRAAHIVGAGRQIGTSREQLRELLRPRDKWIAASLFDGMTVDCFLKKVMEDAEGLIPLESEQNQS
jgi:hypothetical protein